MAHIRRPGLALIAAVLALGASSGMTIPGDIIAEPPRRRESRCGGYPTPPAKPREPTPAEVAAAERREKRNVKRAEQMRRAAKGGA